jgi:hypothetical protein
MDDKNLTDGFNSGYFLAKEKPELLQTLLNGASGNSEYLEGIKAGQKEYEKERMRQATRERFKEQYSKNQSNDNDMNRDR